MRAKKINILLSVLLTSLTCYAQSVDFNVGKKGDPAQQFSFFGMNFQTDQKNENTELLPMDAEANLRRFFGMNNLSATPQEREAVSTGTAAVPDLLPRGYGLGDLLNNSNVLNRQSWSSFAMSQANTSLPRQPSVQNSPTNKSNSKKLLRIIAGTALTGVGVYLIATTTSWQDFHNDGLFSRYSVRGDVRTCISNCPYWHTHYDGKLYGGIASVAAGAGLLYWGIARD